MLVHLSRVHLASCVETDEHPLAWAYASPATKILWGYRVSVRLGPTDDPFEVVSRSWKELCDEIDDAYRCLAPFINPAELVRACDVEGIETLIAELAGSLGIDLDLSAEVPSARTATQPGSRPQTSAWDWAHDSLREVSADAG